MKTIAFIGLGNMGAPIASRLVGKGFMLALYDKRPEAVRSFVAAHGGRAAASLADTTVGADVAITMLPDDKTVRAVVLGDGGLAETMSPDAIIIDMGTSDPHSTTEIGATLAARGIRYVDAPVMGGVIFAREGSLDVMAGGTPEDVERCAPIFEAISRQIFHCGALGSGHALKVLANYVNACALINLIEALAIGRKFGLDSRVMAEAMIEMCTGRQHPLEKKVIPQVLTHKFDTGMALGLIAKDLAITTDFAHSIGATTPLADRVCDIWRRAEAKIGGNADQTKVALLWESDYGIKLNNEALTK